ncbi:MAG: NAD(P)H-dependent oxidoreductase [Ruminococcaceae bacterium]|nr:NAD(P)H-dependent oxidoreductase [Oscillospiraceae bacterium]
MMKKLLYIDACIRGKDSRTKRIAGPIVEKLKERYDIETYVLNDMDLTIVKEELVTRRNNGDIDGQVLKWAETVRDADRIVVSAPFWDMSIPAALKNFFELCSIFDVTFKSDDKTCYGNCKAEKMLYITTRGMDIDTGNELEQATSYLKALSWLWGIGPLQTVSAQNMDYVSEDEINEKIDKAIKEGLEIAECF